MIENIVITKLGSESDDSNGTIFTSTTSWSDGGSDLIVYRNGVLQVKSSDYSIIDTYTIKFKYEVEDTEQIQFVITRLSSDEFNKDRIINLDRAVKKLEGKAQTSINKKVYEEEVSSPMYVHSKDVWSDDISSDPSIAESSGIVIKKEITLTEDYTVSNSLGWFASDDGLITSTVKKWVTPRYGKSYTIRLYDSEGVEIPSADPIGWYWDYSSGYLFVSNKNTKKKPFKVVGYIYNGALGGSGSGGSGTWASPVLTKDLLPSLNNLDGEVRLVINDSELYQWKDNQWIKIYNFSKYFKDPVQTHVMLPSTGNNEGDFRLVLTENSIYRWSSTTSEWISVINTHYHDDRYYLKSQVDDLITSVSQIDKSHNHDTLYYRKEIVNEMIRWRPSVANESLLPPYTENLDGDVILTRDTNTIWRFDYFSNPARWIAITSALSTWKEPVKTISDLSIYNNRVGDTRLVLSENQFYFWDGTAWIGTKIQDHNHDDRYYTKDYIDALNFNWKSPVSSETTLPTNGNSVGDVRMTADTLSAFFWDGIKWIKWTSSPKWKDSVNTLLNLPTYGNNDGDTRYVKSENYLYFWDSTTSKWKPLALPSHNHDDIYYKKTELINGVLDTRYYIKSDIDSKFDTNTGHDHDGIDSKKIDYNNLLNIPYFYWKNPVTENSDLPLSNNEIGDVRIVLEDNTCCVWDGSNWQIINNGIFALKDHEHDSRYYSKDEISVMIDEINNNFNSALMSKAEYNHNHDDRYYLKEVTDELIQKRFDINDGHAHTGKDSRRINYYDLDNIPSTYMTHNHDERYFTKDNLKNSGESEVNWDNLTNKPDLGNTHWKSPVQTVLLLPRVNNEVGDIRLVLNDSDIYEWVGNQWTLIGRWDNKYICYWREPVNTYYDLPTVNNVEGDVRLVLSENTFYRWNQNLSVWIIVSQNESEAQVYLNGLQLFGEGIEWARVKEKEIRLKIGAKAGDKVTLILKYETKTMRKDFVAYSGQQDFNFSNGYFREDFLALEGQVQFVRQHAYVNNGNALLIWLNGLLQRVNIDYKEIDSYTFEFFNQLTAEDRVITISLEHASGEDEYIREDYSAELNQKDFILINSFGLGKGNLIVYLNGLLQRQNIDYKEINSSKISFYSACALNDEITFVIFDTEAVAGCCDADQVALGNPKDGQWSDGLFEFYSEYKVAYALDDINEVLLEVVPEKPVSLQSLDFETTLKLYSGYESIGNDFYEGTQGSYRNYLIKDTNFYLYTKGDNAFGEADKGVLSLYMNGLKIDEFSLYKAFVEQNRKTKQSSISYGVQANGANFDEGKSGTDGALRNSENNYISIISIESYNNFSQYQKAKIRLNIVSSLLRKGYNYIYLTHQTDSNIYTSITFKFFYDNSDSYPEIVDEVNIEEVEVVSNKYISGVRYYSLNDKFKTDFIVSRAFNNTFSQTPTSIEMTGLNLTEIEYDDSNIKGVSLKPKIGEIIDYNGEFKLNKYNEYSIDATLELCTYNPFGKGQSKKSSSKNRLVNTYTSSSTDKIEYFRDENYRLLEGDYNEIPSIRKNVWNSKNPLVDGQCIVYNQSLMYAKTNFIGYSPSQIVDYSNFSQTQYYFRSFYDNEPKNNGTFQILGISEDILTKKKIIIDIKLPGTTGWLSLNNYYDICTYTGADGDGCLLKVEGNNYYFSTGTISTSNSGFMYIVRITMNSDSSIITYMELI